MRYTTYAQPPGISRKIIVVSATLHVLLFLLILLSPYFARKKKIAAGTKFFEIVNMAAPRPAAPVQPPKPEAKPKPVPPTPPREKVKTKPSPTIVPKSEPTPQVNPTPVETEPEPEPEYVVPVDAVVSNQAFGVYDWYLANIISRVQNNWNPPRGISGEEDLVVLVSFNILRTGEITDVRIKQGSGDATLDRLGVRAIERAAPFGRLPPRFEDDALEVTFTLRYTR